MKYSDYFGALLNADSEHDRAIIFFERLGEACAVKGLEAPGGPEWRDLAGRIGFEYHPAASLEGPVVPSRPDWAGLEGLCLLADALELGDDAAGDKGLARRLKQAAPYRARYGKTQGLAPRIAEVRKRFAWLLALFDEATCDDFPAGRGFVEALGAAGATIREDEH